MRAENEVPPGWKEMRLQEFATLQRGFDLPVQKRNIGAVPVYAANGQVGYHDMAIVEGPGVITGRSGTIGEVLYTERNFWPLNTALYVKDFHGNEPAYVYRFLAEFGLERFSSGTGVPTLNRNVVHKQRILVPARSIQKKIVEILNAVDDAVEATRAVIEQICRLKSALLQDLLTNGLPGRHKKYKEVKFIGRVPDDWEIVNLSKVAASGRGTFVNGPFGSDLLTSDFVAEGVSVLYIQDIREGVFKRVTNIYVTKAKATELDFCSVVPGDVLITKVGDPPCIAAVYPEGEPSAIITQDVIRIRPDLKIVDPLFLTTVMNSWIGGGQVRRILITGTRDRVSLSDFKMTTAVLPPLEEQQEISRLMRSVDNRLSVAELHLEHLSLTKTALSQGLLTGRIPVDTTDKEVA